MSKLNYKIKCNLKRLVFPAVLLFLGSTIIYLTIDYFGPSRIALNQDKAFGLSCLRAKDLIVQEYDADGNLWATRGMIIYRLKKGHNYFKKVAHVPTRFSVYWFRNFSILRRLTVRPECIEMVVTKSGGICALSAGWFWYLPPTKEKFKKTMKLTHYGFGDQGIRNDGITIKNDSSIFWGEYFQNTDLGIVNIFKSIDNNRSWEIAYQFQQKQIRHIHAIQNDPYSEKIWVCTGDKDSNSVVAWSDDKFKSLSVIGYGSQQWRVCQLVFTKEAVYWGTDTDPTHKSSGIYRWDRNTGDVLKLKRKCEPVFYGTRLEKGTIVLSSAAWDLDEQKDIDGISRLYIINGNDKIISIDCGKIKHYKPGFFHKYAKLRLQRNQGGSSLAISCLNQTEFPDGDLLIISEGTLLSAWHAKSVKGSD